MLKDGSPNSVLTRDLQRFWLAVHLVEIPPPILILNVAVSLKHK